LLAVKQRIEAPHVRIMCTIPCLSGSRFLPTGAKGCRIEAA
jgi:hypothetical protein